MTTIKMNDGRTQYDVKEDFYDICMFLCNANKLGNYFIQLTDMQLGEVLLSINNILSVRTTNNV